MSDFGLYLSEKYQGTTTPTTPEYTSDPLYLSEKYQGTTTVGVLSFVLNELYLSEKYQGTTTKSEERAKLLGFKSLHDAKNLIKFVIGDNKSPQRQ